MTATTQTPRKHSSRRIKTQLAAARVTPAELAALKETAGRDGMTISDYIRARVLPA